MRTAIVIALALTSATAARAGIVYTATTGPACKDSSKPGFGEWTCPGPGGYVARFADEGNLAAIAIGRGPHADARLESASQFRGSGRVFGDKIQWYVVDGTPRAAVLRIWRRDDADREIQELNVYAINLGVACEFAVVDVKTPSANEKALSQAADAARWHCTEK